MRSLAQNLCVAMSIAVLFAFATLRQAGAEEQRSVATAFFLASAYEPGNESNDIGLVSNESAADAAAPAAETIGEQTTASAEELPASTNDLTAVGEECAECGDAISSCCSCRNPWYVSISGAWQQRETVHEVGDPQTFIEFDSGFAANAAIGAHVDSFRFEFETSFMNNEVDQAGAAGLSSSSPGNVNLRSYMFNVYHDVQFKNSCWKPYVGAGVGIYQSEINGLIPDFFNTIGPPFNTTPINCTSDMPFCYQFRVGVTRPISCHTELFTGYRYFRGEELEFASAPFAAAGAPTFHPDGAKVHAIEFGLRVNF